MVLLKLPLPPNNRIAAASICAVHAMCSKPFPILAAVATSGRN